MEFWICVDIELFSLLLKVFEVGCVWCGGAFLVEVYFVWLEHWRIFDMLDLGRDFSAERWYKEFLEVLRSSKDLKNWFPEFELEPVWRSFDSWSL
jgi:hypothetical protein